MMRRLVLLVTIALTLMPASASAQIYYGDAPADDGDSDGQGEADLTGDAEATDGDEDAGAEGDAASSEAATDQASAAELVIDELLPSYEPLLGFDFGENRFAVLFSLAERVDLVSAFPIDDAGNEYESDAAFNTQLRVGANLDLRNLLGDVRLLLEYEHDLLVGVHTGGYSGPADLGVFMPDSGDTDTVLRRASMRLDAGPDVHFLGGLTTSHWGMGLVANDGDHGWEPGSAAFLDPRGGDRVIRAMGIVGPLSDAGLLVGLGGDSVEGDDVLLEGDRARQLVGFISLGATTPNHVGIYGVVRRQVAEDGDVTDVHAIDLEGGFELEAGDTATITVDAEAVYIWGETSLGPTSDFPVHELSQLGAALRTRVDFGGVGAILDMLYASGDNNIDDDVQSAFRADQNYQMGMLLYRYVNAAHTARSAVTAFDPALSGLPTEDLDRLPTRGSPSNTIAFFPRGFWQPIPSLEIFGGVLLALAAVDPVDPFHTRIAGGDPRNAFDADPGGYWGTEFDLGVRYRRLIAGTELTVGLEGAMLLPGEALVTASGDPMASVSGARASLRYRF